MQHELIADFSESLRFADPSQQKELFRDNFQHALRECVRHRFSIEESFGMIWNETLDEVPLLPQEQAELYESLIRWAKTCTSPDMYSDEERSESYA